MAVINISGTNGPGLTEIWDGSSATNWTSNRGVSVSTEVFIQGTNALGMIVAKNTDDTILYNYRADNGNSNFDVSATDGHIYMWLKCDIAPFLDTVEIGVESSTGQGGASTGIDQWVVADNTGTSLEWYGEWKCFVVDVNSTPDSTATTGTVDLSNIYRFRVRFDNSNSGNIRSIENTYIDVARFGQGYLVTGTDASFKAAYDIDNAVGNKYGIISQVGEVNFIQGRVQFGDGTTSTTCTSDNETVVFLDNNVSSTLYEIIADSATMNITSGTFKAAGTTANARYVFDMSQATDVTMEGTAFTRAGLMDFASGQEIQNCVFNDCLQIDPSTAVFTNNTLANSTDTGGALYWNGSTNTHTNNFINCDKGVEVTQTTNQSFSGMTFDDEAGNFDVHLNNGGTSIEIAKTNLSNPNSYTATGGGTVTFTASYTHVLEGLELNTEVTYVTAGTSTQLFHVEDATTSDGNGKYKTTYTHGGGASVDILIHHYLYQPDISNIYGLTLPSAPATVKVQMFLDDNYSNP